MVRFASLLIVLAALVPLQAADPTTPIHWSAARTKELITEAASKLNKQTGMSPQRFMDSAFMMYREKSSGAAAHTGHVASHGPGRRRQATHRHDKRQGPV